MSSLSDVLAVIWLAMLAISLIVSIVYEARRKRESRFLFLMLFVIPSFTVWLNYVDQGWLGFVDSFVFPYFLLGLLPYLLVAGIGGAIGGLIRSFKG